MLLFYYLFIFFHTKISRLGDRLATLTLSLVALTCTHFFMPVEDFRSVVYMGCDFMLFACTNTFNQNASVTCAEVMNISHLPQQLVYPFGECFLALSRVVLFNYIYISI